VTQELESLDLVWGVRAIAVFIGRTNRQTYEALAKGELPARKVNGRWVASRKALREFFEEIPLRGEKR
jgi:hypothetical protein